ncbi:hypothetical protein TNCV_957891 [Trichonephila clavipes]|nr:hypothetical protein TNCV_957891 [Trichonephila clavipes]
MKAEPENSIITIVYYVKQTNQQQSIHEVNVKRVARGKQSSKQLCGINLFNSTDEAHFWLNGYVNKQKCRIRSEGNPQVYVETPLHSEKLTVWCALWAGGILLQKRRRPQRYSQW